MTYNLDRATVCRTCNQARRLRDFYQTKRWRQSVCRFCQLAREKSQRELRRRELRRLTGEWDEVLP